MLTSTSIALWQPATALGLQRDNQQQAWFSGAVNAVLAMGESIIVGTDAGGLWVVTPRPLDVHGNLRYRGIPLSDDWAAPNTTITSLAFMPGMQSQFFAGCGGDLNGVTSRSGVGGVVFVKIDNLSEGAESWQTTNLNLPAAASDVYRIVVLAKSRRIIVSTSGRGVWWSDLPNTLSVASGYHWKQAIDLPDGGYSGLAEAESDTVVAAAWGDVARGLHGLFMGRWHNNDLVFTPVPVARMGGVDVGQMLRTSVASCDSDRTKLYAASAAPDNTLLAVLASADGGVSWRRVSQPQNTGLLGFYVNSIAVSPIDADLVALGWAASAAADFSRPIFSTNGGSTWSSPGTASARANVHADMHAVYFSPTERAPNRFVVGTDGGIAITEDLGMTYVSAYNKHLQVLEFYPNTFSVSSRFPGLMAGGTQDNGDIYCSADGADTAWRTLQDGDGNPTRFVDEIGSLLWYVNDNPNHAQITFWDPSSQTFTSSTTVPVDGDANGLPWPVMEAVRFPNWAFDGRLMYAVAARLKSDQDPKGTPNSQIYGLFANKDGSNAEFSHLGNTDETVSALASRGGHTILLGTQSGRILTFKTVSRSFTDLQVPPSFNGTGAFQQIDDTKYGSVWGLHVTGRLIRYDGSSWRSSSPAPDGTGFVAFAADPRLLPQNVYAATDTAVFWSPDYGATWLNISEGLPTLPNCRDLKLAADEKGGQDLYLATYGRSVWKVKANGPDIARVPPSPVGLSIPGEVATILAGVIGDGGGLVMIGSQILVIPPRTPVRDILGALAINEIGQHLSEAAAREIGLVSWGIVARSAADEIERLRGNRSR